MRTIRGSIRTRKTECDVRYIISNHFGAEQRPLDLFNLRISLRYAFVDAIPSNVNENNLYHFCINL